MLANNKDHVYFYLTLVRHGQTNENHVQIIQGHNDTNLSECGQRQANELGACLANLSVDGILSSDLKRAYHTAEALQLGQKTESVPIFSDALMRERNFGVHNGKSRSLVHEFIRETYDKPTGCKMWRNSEAECSHQVSWRALCFLFDLLKTVSRRPAKSPPALSKHDETDERLPLFLPLNLPPLPIAFISHPPTPKAFENPFTLPPSNGSEFREISYNGHYILVSHGQWTREFMHILASHSRRSLGFPSKRRLMPVLSNCEFCQFGIAFRKSEITESYKKIRSMVPSNQDSNSCPFQIDLDTLPFDVVCYHTRLSSNIIDERVISQSRKPLSEEEYERRPGKSINAAGVEMLYFAYEDDEYAGLPQVN